MKRVIVIGSKGQDGRLLCERLIRNSCAVLGIANGTIESTEACNFLKVDISDRHDVLERVKSWRPDEIYYLAAFHHSSQDAISDDPIEIFNKSHSVHVTGLLHFLEAIRMTSLSTRLFYAASSLVFGASPDEVQNEATPMNPRCVYGITKASGIHCCRYYRATHGVYAASGFLYNHESPYRAEKFVSQKIIRRAVDIYRGGSETLILGDLSARIDWGYAPDFVEAMSRILSLPEAHEFVVATGETHTVQEFVEITFKRLGLNWKKHVKENPALLNRRNPPSFGDASKLRRLTDWRPTVSFEKLVETLLDAELGNRIRLSLTEMPPP
ncbi:MAG: GDP-mannose 4,6-dehydratase [Verrucomicrobiota bacterium]